MDLAGQGKSPDNSVPKKNGNQSNIAIIEFKPIFPRRSTKSQLPTKIPDSGSHGGFHVLGGQNKYNPVDKGNSHQKIYISGVGHGAGSIIPSSSGPVLIGSLSLVPNHGSLGIIAPILLLISAIIWAIIYLIIPKCRKKAKDDVDRDSNNNTIEQLSLLQVNTGIKNKSASLISSIQDGSKQVSLSGNLDKQLTQQSVKGSILRSGLRSQSSNSLWSYQTSVADSYLSLNGPFSSTLLNNAIVESQGRQIIFTVSELKSPNTWERNDNSSIPYCEDSKYDECLEVLFMFKETLLVGKMKNLRHKKNDGEFVIQVWNISDGTLIKYGSNELFNNYLTCDALCSAHDEFLVCIRQMNVFVWNVVSNTVVCRVELPNLQLMKGKPFIETTKSSIDIVIMIFYPRNSITQIFTVNFHQLLAGSPSFVHRSYSSHGNVYSLISETSIFIASKSGEIRIWDFYSNTENIFDQNKDELILKIQSSPSGDLFLLQSRFKISIWMTNLLSKISEISVSSSQICSIAFSTKTDFGYFLAIAEDGSIHIYSIYTGEKLRILQTSVPIVYMIFSSGNRSLIVIADRASHYRLFVFNL